MKSFQWISNTIVSTSVFVIFCSLQVWWCQNWFLDKKSNVNWNMLAKVPSGMSDWVQNVPTHVDTTRLLKFKRRYLSDSKYRWNHFEVLASYLSKHKPTIETTIKSICTVSLLFCVGPIGRANRIAINTGKFVQSCNCLPHNEFICCYSYCRYCNLVFLSS